ncbi:MAG: 4'-phosphopantetheinyl transferase superfamily protein [bacterium]|nr:4'-phosphopantetheinyl transferase superfamily protein [bacterium]
MLGIDLVFLPEFEKKFKNISLDKVFSLSEMSENKSKESLAGIFAAKEAFFKAIGRKEDWLTVWIEKNKSGKPHLKTSLLDEGKKTEVSISHAGDYAIAIVMIND